MYNIPVLTIRAGIAALMTIGWAAFMGYFIHQYPYPHVFHQDVNSPVIALELSRNAGDIDAVLHRSQGTGRNNPAVDSMTTVNWLDLVFIPLYTFAIWSFARVFSMQTRWLTISVLGTALFGYLEDVQIFRALNGRNPPIFIPSLVKWGLLAIAFILLGRILLRSNAPVYSLSTKRLLAIGYLISAAVILLDVAFGQWIGYSHIALGVTIFPVLLVVNVVGFLGPYFAIPGIKQEYVENFCEERKKFGNKLAVKSARLPARPQPKPPVGF